VATITNWSIVDEAGNYVPPACGRCLHGPVCDHAYQPDGRLRTTTPIRYAEGCYTVQTVFTTYLLLGPPSTEYLEGLKRLGYTIDLKNPFRFILWNWLNAHKPRWPRLLRRKRRCA
jgi:hypothetical protein